MVGRIIVHEPKSLEWINNEINRLSALVEKEPPRLMEYLPKQKPGEPAMPVPMEFMERVWEDEKVNNAWSEEQRKIKQELDVLSRDLAELQWMNSKHKPGNNICVYELPSHKMYLFLLHNDGIILMLDSDDLPDLILKESAQDPKATFIGRSDFERRQVFANICERLYTMEEIIAPDYAKRIMDAQPHINQFTVPAMYALAQKTGILIVDNDGIHRDLMSDVARAYFALNKFYFARFEKLKRTRKAAMEQAEESSLRLSHLKSIEASFETAESEEDLMLIAEELKKTGYIKKTGQVKNRKAEKKSSPMHFVSSDGYDIYVGRNNIQNDELTFKTGHGNDWWFHSKTYPGSHVLLVTGRGDPMEVPDSSFNEAGRIAAYFSTGREQGKVDIDYTIVKNVKKPAGAVPGYVIYHTNYSMTVEPDISGIRRAGQ